MVSFKCIERGDFELLDDIVYSSSMIIPEQQSAGLLTLGVEFQPKRKQSMLWQKITHRTCTENENSRTVAKQVVTH